MNIDESCALAREKYRRVYRLLAEADDILDLVLKAAKAAGTYEEAYDIYNKMPCSQHRAKLLAYLRGTE